MPETFRKRGGGCTNWKLIACRPTRHGRKAEWSPSLKRSRITQVLFILMLEDDHERIKRFNAIIDQHQEETHIVIRRTAADFIDAHTQLQSIPNLIALDHDLFTDHEDAPDPGDGRDVARYLAQCEPICPVLIHSTNVAAADSMLFTLRDAEWTVDRIAPLGDEWIEEYWYPIALEMVCRQR